ncbi:MAG TPA: potassium-transporting ATPase subunit C [Pirellulales bacterium]|nr:potassium-transporting ATPase subunit C [Pirellulales bacterium]
MSAHIRANLWLLFLTIVLCCILYPLVLLIIGQTLFHDKAQGSLVVDASDKVIGSRLIAQPFTSDEYFQPRPSAASYNGAASGASNWGGNNYLLRDRVAKALGPIVKYNSGEKKGQPVAPDIEAWFQKDQFGGKPGVVAQWADAHNTVAQNWVGTTYDDKNPTPQQQYVLDWEKSHPDIVAKFKADNPDNDSPAPADLAVVFFENFSKVNPGKFLSVVTKPGPDGKSTTSVEPVSDGADIQSNFFDMWLSEHPDAELQTVPADMVMASGSGLDPDITLDNALWQLDRVAAAWAKKTSTDEAVVHKEIEKQLRDSATAPLGGTVGVPLVNVLETNLALRARFGGK